MHQPGLFAEHEPIRGSKVAPPEPGASRGDSFARIALNLPVRTEFTYRVPTEFGGRLAPGMRALVPFSTRREIGVVVGLERHSDVDASKLRSVIRCLDDEPVVDTTLLGLTQWIAEEYLCSWGEALAAVLPAPLKHGRKSRSVRVVRAAAGAAAALAELEHKREQQFRVLRTLLDLDGSIEVRELCRKLNIGTSPIETLASHGLVSIEQVEREAAELLTGTAQRPRHAELTDEQTLALADITAALDGRAGAAFLLHGVTGSGKTEVYLRAIQRALELGRGAIVLVPEIALTPQTVDWFRSRFGRVAVLHSRMTDAQRLTMWRSIRRGEARVVVGARSAVFAPVADLGVIVVDEEHEPSFKQNSTPRYNARDVALERARRSDSVCILGTATPALETWLSTIEGRVRRISLTRRIHSLPLPQVRIVDMRVERAAPNSMGLLSRELHALVDGALQRKEQAILFLNRRGFAPVLWCRECQSPLRCARCDISLAWHRRIQRLVCHGCCEERPLPKTCPNCSKPALRAVGVGSERVESAVAQCWPDARVRRMDSDTMLRREDYERALDQFGKGEIDVLVGTQMIAKGLDFPRVTVVGVISADAGLHLPDFRAAERTFQLLAQVAGRAGRSDLRGDIVFQTAVPGHPAIQRAAKHDYGGFVAEELQLRRELDYPPYARLVRIVLEDADESVARTSAEAFADALRKSFEGSAIGVLGPAPAPIERAREQWRYHLLVKASRDLSSGVRVREAIRTVRTGGYKASVTVDIDPVSLL
jgi:primosomal protein N' (replication factor Y)